ncbi:hypothetical protein DV736_g147, partial [Chaetothyriales sp. CBS 134916]
MKLRERRAPQSIACQPKLINPSDPDSKKRKSNVTFKDDDPFEEVYDTESSLSGDDSDVSDFGNHRRQPRIRMAKKEKARRRKLSKLRHFPAPGVPEMSDDELYGDDLEIVVHVDFSGRMLKDPDRGHQSHTASEDGNPLMKLPSELRFRVYMMVLVTDSPIVFHERRDFARSAQLLRTCRAIEQEAAPVLYGRNSFHFERTHSVRGRFFEQGWSAIGFKDVRRFLETIGSTNVSHLKHVSFLLEDGYLFHYFPAHSPERLFVNDPILHRIFRILAESSVLYTFNLFFQGEKPVKRTDYHFLKALSVIRALKVNMPRLSPGLSQPYSSIQDKLRRKLIPIMTANYDESEDVNPKMVKHQVKMYFN